MEFQSLTFFNAFIHFKNALINAIWPHLQQRKDQVNASRHFKTKAGCIKVSLWKACASPLFTTLLYSQANLVCREIFRGSLWRLIMSEGQTDWLHFLWLAECRRDDAYWEHGLRNSSRSEAYCVSVVRRPTFVMYCCNFCGLCSGCLAVSLHPLPQLHLVGTMT